MRKERKMAKQSQQISEVIQKLSPPEVNDRLTVKDSVTTSVAIESPLNMDASFRRQSGEGEASSSQSSSIDPHTPSVNGDLAPSDETLVIKPDFSADTRDITLDPDTGIPVDTLSSSHEIDPRSHWSRLMTRLNNSEEISPRATPQAMTPTPPITSKQTRPESHHGSLPHHVQAMNGMVPVEPSNQEQPGADYPEEPLNKHSSIVPRTSSVSSFSFQLQAPPGASKSDQGGVSAIVSSTSYPASSSSDALAKRTKQLHLLDSVLAEQSTKRTLQQPPMSAHILGAYPHTSKGLFPGQIRVPVRPASVNLDASHHLTTPIYPQQTDASVPAPSGVLPTHPSASSYHHTSTRLPHGNSSQPPSRNNGLSTSGRPSHSLVTQSPLTSHSAVHLPPYGGNTSEIIHRGQMLSILSGDSSTLRHSTAGASFRPGSALLDAGKLSKLSTNVMR